MSHDLMKTYGDKKIASSADGSVMFYNTSYGEAYRAKSIGAFTESYHKFIKSSGLIEKYNHGDIRILDLCLGLGYNCAVSFEYAYREKISHNIHIVSVESDKELPFLIQNLNILWPVNGFKILRRCINGEVVKLNGAQFSLELYISNALAVIPLLSGKFDIIYFDPFSYSKNPDMWSCEIFSYMRNLMSKDSVLVTYACGKTIRQNMVNAGLKFISSPPSNGAFNPGTICMV